MIIGITGGFGCGKSTLLNLFRAKGAEVYSADELCHRIYDEKEPDFFKALTDFFGAEAVNPDGSANRKFIGSRVFADQQAMDFLNSLFQNKLKDKINSIIKNAENKNTVSVIEIPLLFEGDYDKCVDKVLTVYASAENRRKYLAKRGFDFDEMQKRDAHQMPLDEKVKRADLVIVNDSTEEFLKEQFNIIWNDLTR